MHVQTKAKKGGRKVMFLHVLFLLKDKRSFSPNLYIERHITRKAEKRPKIFRLLAILAYDIVLP